MFKIIKFDRELFGVLEGTQLAVGTRIECASYCIEDRGITGKAMVEVMDAFDNKGHNVASMGVLGTCLFTMSADVSQYLPKPKSVTKSA